MPTRKLGIDVLTAAMERIEALYKEDATVVCSFSAGKDSGVVMELTLAVAERMNRLPLPVVMRDEEIMFPGTYEYAERTAARPEIDFHWLIAHQPIINIFDREHPYWWVMDQNLKPEEWVRQAPDYAYEIPEKHIQGIVTPDRFPTLPGKRLFDLTGMRADESSNRKLGIHSTKGYIRGMSDWGVWGARPIYDFHDGDIWKCVGNFSWDYNHAYDTMARFGIPKRELRIAPPTMSLAGVPTLSVAARAWPLWWDRVCNRLPGLRTAAQFGRRSCSPNRRIGESWQDTFWRECINEAPAEWIKERARKVAEGYMSAHANHATGTLPEIIHCHQCPGTMGCWKLLATAMYNGDPFSARQKIVKHIDPEFFRPGSGTWGAGNPSF